MDEESEERVSDEPQVFDIDKWIAHKEDREHAIRMLTPETKEEKDMRRPFISKVAGPATSSQLAIRAKFHVMRLVARMNKEPVPDEAYDLINDLLDLGQSIKGWRADKIVEAHTGTPKPTQHKSWADVILGRK